MPSRVFQHLIGLQSSNGERRESASMSPSRDRLAISQNDASVSTQPAEYYRGFFRQHNPVEVGRPSRAVLWNAQPVGQADDLEPGSPARSMRKFVPAGI
ncbi:hypothetical protein [Massilia sp. WF1]|uniref:hypothetical protein n=1 Tax=Massilia sp. WF1 TaxID=1406431 RepID=UPI0012E199C1|nr:hypothetical protein [Massilia sp. WF1]